MAATRTKTPQQRLALREQIYLHYCSGQSQTAIAKALSLNQTAISYHIRKAREAHRVEAESRKQDRLTELDRLRNQCWQAWEQDRTAQATVFLNQVQQAIKQERALLGLDCAKSLKAEVTFDELPHDTLDSVVEGPQEP